MPGELDRFLEHLATRAKNDSTTTLNSAEVSRDVAGELRRETAAPARAARESARRSMATTQPDSQR